MLTEDKDFGDLVFRHSKAAPGIVLLRISPGTSQSERLLAAVERYSDRLFGHYLVIEDARFRSRPLWSEEHP